MNYNYIQYQPEHISNCFLAKQIKFAPHALSLSLKTKDGIIFALLDPLSTFVQSCNRSISNKSPCFQSLHPLFPSWVSRHHPINQIKTVCNHPNLIQVFPCSQNRRRNDSPTVKFRSPCEPPPAEEAYHILCPGIEFPPPKRAFFHGSG